MALVDDLKSQVQEILDTRWASREGKVVPDSDSVKLGNDAVKIKGAVLYADLAESTVLVDRFPRWYAAEVYKSFLHCASKIIGARDGVITAFDGDRVMAVFIGDYKHTNAAICGLQIKYAVREIINPLLKAEYPDKQYTVTHGVGIDTCELFVAKTGVRGANDLVWVGRAANYAAKLCSLRNGDYTTYITEEVFKQMNDKAKYTIYNPEKKLMWERRTWNDKNIVIYRSNYWRKLD
jgi:class 3 adenylate cyclase